ncbi:hypothetical protein L5470_11140 [Synechococcus sp. PCC 6717]|jgi:hypothetical protein|uniref:hypothetical protein n=1 Tax=Parathermosynechococcus lividus TaxID=33070 RepID=UPI000C1A617A|nr:hypothetical protein [Thermostichus lividus]MCH9056630.1 hypothetical protein [Synechococcus sp. PCC 6716]MCI3281519.1 hypothetical protein [Synechococcus sp. PCC 6717]
MDKFDPTQLRSQFDNTSEGWLVHVYSGDRRLLCVLDSSHAWTFLLGCGVGILLALGWFNLAKYSPSTTYVPATTPPQGLID